MNILNEEVRCLTAEIATARKILENADGEIDTGKLKEYISCLEEELKSRLEKLM